MLVGLMVVVVVMTLDGGSVMELFSAPQAILLIFGGSLAASTITVPLSVVKRLPQFLLKAIRSEKFDRQQSIEMLVKLADKARREGLLALEDEAKKMKDPFVQQALMLVVDGVDPEQVRSIMESNIEQTEERHRVGYGFFQQAGGFAPTFGIIGTVMGLINVLKQLDDPSKLGGSIATAFLATLWGLLTANLIFLPLAAKLRRNSEEETTYRLMLMEGVLAIQSGENPRVLREKLSAYAPEKAAGAQKQPRKAAETQQDVDVTERANAAP
jgi:chemotaxis protein MotA